MNILNIQFKKGVLELCVLSMLSTGDKYGYELAQGISKKIDISEGTLYPLLRRLKNDGYFETYLMESSGGPPRKYYKLTEKGYSEYILLKTDWYNFVHLVDEIVGGDDK